ncbi:hypothetical protein [Streptomyces sp. NPDC058451]|uniref:hypothetical protein n=1 Tax=Streptomyces sp. NPDC058451 TaxID=3346506 RepID=UPI003651F385
MDGLPQGGGWVVGVELLGIRRRGAAGLVQEAADVFLARALLRCRERCRYAAGAGRAALRAPEAG